jgi:hypothetical protein
MVGGRTNATAGRIKRACAAEECHPLPNGSLQRQGQPLSTRQPLGVRSLRAALLVYALLESIWTRDRRIALREASFFSASLQEDGLLKL